MPLLTQYAGFFISPFGGKTVCGGLNAFLKSRRIVNVENRLTDGQPFVFVVKFLFPLFSLITILGSSFRKVWMRGIHTRACRYGPRLRIGKREGADRRPEPKRSPGALWYPKRKQSCYAKSGIYKLFVKNLYSRASLCISISKLYRLMFSPIIIFSIF
jgi:hypothetical protein